MEVTVPFRVEYDTPDIVPIGVEAQRLRMKLAKGMSSELLWNRDKIRGDIVIKYRRVGMDFQPYEMVLNRVID